MAAAYLKAPEITVIQRCTKIPFPSRKIALQIVRNARKGSGTTVVGEGRYSAYRCSVCKGWHTGHKRV